MAKTEQMTKDEEYHARKNALKIKRKIKYIVRQILIFLLVSGITAAAVFTAVSVYDGNRELKRAGAADTSENSSAVTVNKEKAARLAECTVPEYVTVDILPNGNARTGAELLNINDIVIHYVGNAGTSANQNYAYFADPETRVSAHFIVGLSGEVIQCVPLNEQSCASNERNPDTISIEACHPEADGKFTDATYKTLVKLTAWLLMNSDLTAENVIRHYDVTGKICPKYFVDNADAWETFKADVASSLETQKKAAEKAASSSAVSSSKTSSKTSSDKSTSSKTTSSKTSSSKVTSSKATSGKSTSSKATLGNSTSSKSTESKSTESKSTSSKDTMKK